MADKKSTKVVRIPESALVKIIEGIVEEAVAAKKKEWIVEQEAKTKATLKEQVEAIMAEKFAEKK
jgi:hypothetical protein